MTWIDEIIESHKELESPSQFWFWAALAAISASVKDNVWFHKQIYNLYPNIYVMFHADSGVKKGPPVNMAKKLVKEVNNTRIISGRSSIQGILKELGTGYTQPGGTVISKAVAFICSSELSSSIVEDNVANTIFTDLYDRHYNEGEWKSLLKMEQFTIKDPCITMLTATNEAHTEQFFERQDMQGGYFARTFVIYAQQSETVNSLMFPLKNPPDDKKAAQYLKELAKLKGPFEMSQETREYFDRWYRNFRETTTGYKDNTGTLNRFDDSVLKVAMLLSLGMEAKLEISQEAIERAVIQCEKLVGNLRQINLGKGGKSDWANHKAILIKELITRPDHRISRTQLNKQYWMFGNLKEWDDVAASLEGGEHIKIQSIGNQIIYVMEGKSLELWKAHFEGKI